MLLGRLEQCKQTFKKADDVIDAVFQGTIQIFASSIFQSLTPSPVPSWKRCSCTKCNGPCGFFYPPFARFQLPFLPFWARQRRIAKCPCSVISQTQLESTHLNDSECISSDDLRICTTSTVSQLSRHAGCPSTSQTVCDSLWPMAQSSRLERLCTAPDPGQKGALTSAGSRFPWDPDRTIRWSAKPRRVCHLWLLKTYGYSTSSNSIDDRDIHWNNLKLAYSETKRWAVFWLHVPCVSCVWEVGFKSYL